MKMECPMCKNNEKIKVTLLTLFIFTFASAVEAKSSSGTLSITGQIVNPSCTYIPAENVLKVTCFDSTDNKYHHFTSNSSIPERSYFSTVRHYVNDKGTVSTYLVSYN